MPVSRPPVWSFDGIDFNGPVVDGVQWIATADSEPLTAPAPTTSFTPKYQRTGSFWTPGFVERGVFSFTIKAYAIDKSEATLTRAELQALALCQDTSVLYPLVFHSPIGNLVQHVTREGDISITPITGAQHPGFEFSIQFSAPDPRRYEETWQTMSVGLPPASVSGLDFGAQTILSVNPYFETDATGWSGRNSATISRVAGGAQGSGFTGKVTSTQAVTLSGIVSTSYISGIVAGTTYGVSAWVNLTSLGRVNLTIDWYASTTYLSSSTVVAGDPIPANTWTRVARMADAPATATQAKVYVERSVALAVADYFLVDSIEMWANTAGLDFSAGLDFGAASGSSTIILDNSQGRAPTAPILTLTGPLTNPVITTASGSIKYNGTLTTGQTLVINPEDPSALLGGTTPRNYLVNPAQWSAFIVQPGATLSMGLSHSGAPTDTGTLTASFRPAFW